MTDPRLDQRNTDSDEGKGATEDDGPRRDGQDEEGNVSRTGQFPHRSMDERYAEIAPDEDSDFPEPGGNPEHS